MFANGGLRLSHAVKTFSDGRNERQPGPVFNAILLYDVRPSPRPAALRWRGGLGIVGLDGKRLNDIVDTHCDKTRNSRTVIRSRLSGYRRHRRAVNWLSRLNHWPAKATNERVELGAHMHLRGNALRSTPQNEDYHLAGAIVLVLAGYIGFFLYLYWLMQPTISAAKPELTGYRPPPKTVVRLADSPSVLPAQP